MEIKTKNIEKFDTNENYTNMILSINTREDEKYNGNYIIQKVEEDFLELYNIRTRRVIEISITVFKRINELDVVGTKINKIKLYHVTDLIR